MGPVISPHAGQPRPDATASAPRRRARSCVAGGQARRPRASLAAGNFLAPTVFDRRAAGHAPRPGGGFRPGAGGDPVRRPRTRSSQRPTAPSTGWRRRSGPTTSSAPTPLARRHPGRQRQHQLPDRQPARSAVRRLQAERHRPRAEPPRDGSLHPGQERRRQSQSAAVRLVRSLARGAKAVGRRSPLEVSDPIRLHNCQRESLKDEPATARLERDPAGRSSLWLPSSTIRVCIPWYPPPLPSLPSLPTSIRSSRTRREDEKAVLTSARSQSLAQPTSPTSASSIPARSSLL